MQQDAPVSQTHLPEHLNHQPLHLDKSQVNARLSPMIFFLSDRVAHLYHLINIYCGLTTDLERQQCEEKHTSCLMGPTS